MSQTAIGEYNIADTTGADGTARGDYVLIIGNGTADNARSNALTVDWSGKVKCGDYSGNFKSIFDIFYPVGSYYETSDTSFDPNVAWGGTWVLETEGQVHVSGSANGTYQVSGALTDTTDGGEATHTLGTDEMPSHYHAQRAGGYTYTDSNGQGASTAGGQPTWGGSYTGKTVWTFNTGGGQAHENMPPYIVVNRWHRTA